MKNKTKICVYCNNEIPLNEKVCRYCLKDLENNEFLSKNHGSYKYTINSSLKTTQIVEDEDIDVNLDKKEYSNVLPIRRFFILMIFTSGLYKYYWFFKNSEYTKISGKDINPTFRTILFIIPIIKIYIYYILLRDMKNIIAEEKIEVYTPIYNVLLYFFLPFLGFWSMINVQESINEYWRLKQNELPTRRSLTSTEKAIILVFILIWLIIAIFLIMSIVTFIMKYSY